jgi:hypothetical protein
VKIPSKDVVPTCREEGCDKAQFATDQQLRKHKYEVHKIDGAATQAQLARIKQLSPIVGREITLDDLGKKKSSEADKLIEQMERQLIRRDFNTK